MASSAPQGYDLVRLLGRGGMGEVYLARRKADGLPVALKVSLRTLGEQGRSRLRREAALLGRASSPHLPGFLGLFEDDGRLILAMEFVEGIPLQAWVEEDRSSGERLELVQRVLPDLARGLQTLHQLGIVHRDLKPANCIVAEDRTVLVDLGLARGPDVKTLTATGVSIGTPDYLPPEQMTGEAVDARADLYQLALVAQVLLTGVVRGPGENPIQAAVRRSVRKPTPLHVDHPWIPVELSDWTAAGLHPDPGGRPDPATHLAAAERACIAAAVGGGSTPSESPSWFAESTFTELAQVRNKARSHGWSKSGSDSASIWRDLERWEQQALSVSAVVREGRGSVEDSAPTNSEPISAKPQFNWRSLWILPLLPLAIWIGTLLRSDARPPTNPHHLSFDVQGSRLRLVESGKSTELPQIVHPSGLSLQRGDDGYWGVETQGVEGEIQLRWRGKVRKLFAPTHEIVSITNGFKGPHLRLRDVAYSGRCSIESGPFRSQVFGSGMVQIPLNTEMLSQQEALLTLDLGEKIYGRQKIRWAQLAQRQLDTTTLPARPIAGRSSPDPALHAALTAQVPRVRGSLSVESLNEDLRQEWYERCIPYALDEWLLENNPESHSWSANFLLGDLLEIHRQAVVPSANQESENLSTQHFPLGIRFGSELSLKNLVGQPESAENINGAFDQDGIFRTTLKLNPRQDLSFIDLTIQTTGTEPGSVVVVHLGARRLYLPAFQRYSEIAHRVPVPWFQGAISSSGELEVGFSFLNRWGFKPPSKPTIGWLNLRRF